MAETVARDTTMTIPTQVAWVVEGEEEGEMAIRFREQLCIEDGDRDLW